jgi:predicted nucleic acid-binding protein
MSQEMIEEWKMMIVENSFMVLPTKKLEIVKNDPDDNKFFEAAIAANAHYIVSQDKKHVLSISEFRGIKTIHPQEFVKLL